uniref:AP180 N-terminal homology (ANTH) domain-containing protein n=1 Tax=Leersia perrieri TaxID=77586 RepID=A0A0D9XEB9_9ORYZ
MGSLRQWWRRAAAAVMDRRSLLLSRVRPRRTWQCHHRELDAAVIRATSHEERWVEYRAAGRVFRWARASSPSSLAGPGPGPIVWALGRRARRTRRWAVALKALMLAHGVLLVSPRDVGRVPFELAKFRDRSAPPALSAFVRAYFRYLDYRSLLAAEEHLDIDSDVDKIAKLQLLLELLLQIRPYGDGMEVPLVLEAMDCALIEIFQVYSDVCTGVARFLVDGVQDKSTAAAGVNVLWKAVEQSAQLSSYLALCRSLGVVNARRLPDFERVVRHDDVREFEGLLARDAADEDVSQGAVESVR